VDLTKTAGWTRDQKIGGGAVTFTVAKAFWVHLFRASFQLTTALAFFVQAPGASLAQQVDPKVAEFCLKAADFAGCVRSMQPGGFSGSQNTRFEPVNPEKLGKQLYEFGVLRESTGECKLIVYENAASFCGSLVARENIRSWTRFHKQTPCNLFGWCPGERFDHTISFVSSSGFGAFSFSLMHRPTTYKFDEQFSAWAGIAPGRMASEDLDRPLLYR
jgi:hypothetical protein